MKSFSLAIVVSMGVCLAAAIWPADARGAVNVNQLIATDAQGNEYNATAALGLFKGNDMPGTVLSELNTGLGAEFDDIEWTYGGKSEKKAGEVNPFTSVNADATRGTLTFDEAYSGAFAISLKSGNYYAIYVFEELSNIVSITFTTQAFLNRKGIAKELSHASLFVGQSTVPTVEPAPVSTPEPTSLAIFALGGASLLLGRRRLWA